MEEGDSQPRVESRGGALLAKYKPTFSEDGKNVMCCCGHDVKVYSVNTGKCIGSLNGHTDFVTSVQLHPKNPLQVFTSSLDRNIRSWDQTDFVKLKTYTVGFPVTSMMLIEKGTELVFYAICQEAENQFTVKRVTPPKDSRSEICEASTIITNIAQTQNALTVGYQNRFVAAISGHNLIVYRTKMKTSRSHHTMDRRRLTCVTSHPHDDRLVTGCADGSIVMWWNFMSTNDSPVHTSIHHWHSLSVLALTFTAEGSYLLSGGSECVLVVWQDDMQKQDFLPRLGAPICHVTVSRDNTHYVTSHTDNMVQIISNNLQVRQIIQGLTRSFHTNPKPTTQVQTSHRINHKSPKHEHRKSKKYRVEAEETYSFPRTGLLLDPRSNALVLNGRPGHLQFYHLQSDELLFNLDIVGENYISPDDMTQPLTMTEIDACALSPDGDWLATAQSRDDHIYSLDLCLKFWKFDDTTQSYSLNTSVDLAHRKPIHCIRFRPSTSGENDDIMSVTCSSDGKFKLWTLRDDTDIYRESTCWDCESVGFYRERRAGDADFSQDGSLLAVTFGDIVTLWNPDTNALQTTLECRDQVTRIMLGNGDCRHLLVACTKNVLMVWNMLTLSVEWVADSTVTTLTRDPTSSNMAAFTKDRELFVFTPDNPQPVYALANVSRHDVTTAIFIPQSTSSTKHQWMAGARLYFMDQDQKLLTVGYDNETVPGSERIDTVYQTLPQTMLSLTLGHKSVKDRTVSEKLHAKPHPAYQMFEAPAHTLPPLSSNLSSLFLASLLKTCHNKTNNNDSDKHEDSSMDVEVSSINDSDSDNEPSVPRRSRSGDKDGAKAQPNPLSESERLTRQMASVSLGDCSWLRNVVKDVTVLE